MNRKKIAIIVAGGKGERMNAAIPKQFLELQGKPILMHTIERFHAFDKEMQIILVLPSSQFEFWDKLCEKYNFQIKHQLVEGGDARFYSVKNALDTINQESLIAIHDGVRPLIDSGTIERCFAEAERSGAAIPVIDLVDSIRKIMAEKSKAVNRCDYKLVQTPQVFKSEVILEGYRQEFSETFTDDASVAETAGYSVNLVEGTRENIKITTPLDLKLAEAFLM